MIFNLWHKLCWYIVEWFTDVYIIHPYQWPKVKNMYVYLLYDDWMSHVSFRSLLLQSSWKWRCHTNQLTAVRLVQGRGGFLVTGLHASDSDFKTKCTAQILKGFIELLFQEEEFCPFPPSWTWSWSLRLSWDWKHEVILEFRILLKSLQGLCKVCTKNWIQFCLQMLMLCNIMEC